MIDWREIDLGGATIEGLTNVCHYGRGILAWGRRGGHPYAARVSSTGDVDESLPRWSGRVSSVLQDDGGDLCVTGGSPPRTHPADDAAEWGPLDEGDPYVSGWVVMGDEDPCNLALGAGSHLYAYEYGGEAPSRGPKLLAGQSGEDLVVAGAEIGLLVAGPLASGAADQGNASTGTSAWFYGNGQWEQIDVVGPVEAYTDAYTRWEPIFAGHVDARPRVFSHAGTALPSPQVDLDRARPRVCVAHVDGKPYDSERPDWDGRLALVVQAVEGVQVWLQHGRGWTMLPGPEGTLQAARLGYNEKWAGWVVTDGRLWSADLSAVFDALG